MANLSKVHESCLLDKGDRELIKNIKRVAAEIEFTGYRDTSILAKELDRQGVLRRWRKSTLGGRFFVRSKWYEKGTDNPASKLRTFIKKHIPELLQQEPHPCLCQKCRTQRTCKAYGARTAAILDTGLINQGVNEKLAKKSLNINAWTVRQDSKGFYRAYKRINGKIRSVYLGRMLDLAEEKIQAANEKWGL